MTKEKIKNGIIIILSIVVIILIGIILYIHLNKENSFSTRGKVIGSGNGYIIIEGENEDYIYETENSYKDGTILELDIQSLDKNTSPTIIKDGKIVILEEPSENSFMSGSVEIQEDTKNQSSKNITEKEATSNNSTNQIETSNNYSNINNKIEENNEKTLNKDELVISYVNEIDPQLENAKNESIIKNGFITITDFLFYDGQIKGVTLNEITTKTKLLVLKAALKIDSKIDSYFPGYKESISATSNKIYTSVKNKIITTYLNTTAKICTQQETLCTDAKRDFESMKKSFGISWNLIKDLASAGMGNLKDWYEIYSGKK